MRRASQERDALRSRDRTTLPAAEPVRTKAAESRSYGEPRAAIAAPAVTEVRLSPAGTFAKANDSEPDAHSERHRQLAIAIRQRIESRLPGRVRNLAVRILQDTVVLEGQCATYYTKQLAQHTALGIIEDEHLENAIVVGVVR